MIKGIKNNISDFGGSRTPNSTEELLNTISHGTGAVLSLTGSLALLAKFVDRGPVALFCVMAYALSLLALYSISTIYHGLRSSQLKKTFQILDHCAIFVLILGTYIPISIIIVQGPFGWFLCLVNTIIAGIGIALNVIDLKRWHRISVVLYVVMGWLVVLVIKPMILAIPLQGLVLLVAGGLAYSIGIFFYKANKIPYMHVVWHLFVLAGSALHFFVIYLYC